MMMREDETEQCNHAPICHQCVQEEDFELVFHAAFNSSGERISAGYK